MSDPRHEAALQGMRDAVKFIAEGKLPRKVLVREGCRVYEADEAEAEQVEAFRLHNRDGAAILRAICKAIPLGDAQVFALPDLQDQLEAWCRKDEEMCK